jgi:polyprenyl-phospho-N-acetylgalactosaminyl synthase
MKLFVIIPAYNEGERIFKVLNEIQNIRLPFSVFSLLVIDDGSTDNTYTEAKRAGVKVLRHILNRGQGAALQTGDQYALKHGAEVIVHFDADGQHQVTDIVKLAKPIINHQVSVVLGSRFLNLDNNKPNNHNNLLISVYQLLATKNIPYLRRVLLAGSLVTNYLITELPLTDAHNGLRSLSRQAAQKINITQDRMAHNTEYSQEIKRLNLSYQEIPVTVEYHQAEKKSQGFFDGIKILKELFLGRHLK